MDLCPTVGRRRLLLRQRGNEFYGVVSRGQPVGEVSAPLFGFAAITADLAWAADTEVAGQRFEVKLNGTKLTLTAKLPGDADQTLHEVAAPIGRPNHA